MNKPHILIIEDDDDFRESLSLLLEDKYDIQALENGVIGLKAALRNPPDLILLDLKMPEMDGFQTCKVLRADKEFDGIPIIVVSGYNTVEDRTRVFEFGADDFIAKPFDNAELLARIQRKLSFVPSDRVSEKTESLKTIQCGNLKINPRDQVVQIEDRVLHLSALEFRLLYVLALHCDELVSRKNIIEKVWDGQPVSDRIIDPHIVSLRNKLVGCTYAISSAYGKGYSLRPLA